MIPGIPLLGASAIRTDLGISLLTTWSPNFSLNPAQVHQDGKVAGEDRFRFHSPSDDVRWANRSSQEDSERVERKVRRPCCQERNSQIRPDGRSPEQRNPGNHLQPNKQGIVRVPEASQGYAGELSGGYGPHQARLLGSPRARWNQHLVEYG